MEVSCPFPNQLAYTMPRLALNQSLHAPTFQHLSGSASLVEQLAFPKGVYSHEYRAAGKRNNSLEIRPVSRAVIEVGTGLGRPARDRTSLCREYTSQHPTPTQRGVPTSQRTAVPTKASSGFQLRLKFTSSASVVGHRR
jgi:hypothetical protein